MIGEMSRVKEHFTYNLLHRSIIIFDFLISFLHAISRFHFGISSLFHNERPVPLYILHQEKIWAEETHYLSSFFCTNKKDFITTPWIMVNRMRAQQFHLYSIYRGALLFSCSRLHIYYRKYYRFRYLLLAFQESGGFTSYYDFCIS